MRIYFYKLLYLALIGICATSCNTSKSFGDRTISYSQSRVSNINFDIPQPEASTEINYSYSNKKTLVKAIPETRKKIVEEPNLEEETSSKVNKRANTGFVFRENIFETANQYKGLKYKSGGRSPSTGFDCSGFACYVMGQHGIKIGGSSQSIAKMGVEKKREELQVGDLVFFGKSGRIHHVGIISKNESGELEMIHSASSSGISIDNIDKSDYWSSRFMYGRDLITPHMVKDTASSK